MAATGPSRGEFDMALAQIEEVKKIALSAKSRPCMQLETIRAWDRWWKGIIVTIFFCILGVGGFAWRMDDRAAAVEDGVEDVRDSVDDLGARVNVISSNQREIQTQLTESATSKTYEDQRLKKVLSEALAEFNTPKRRRDNR